MVNWRQKWECFHEPKWVSCCDCASLDSQLVCWASQHQEASLIIKKLKHWRFKSAGGYLLDEPEVTDLVFAGQEWCILRGVCLCLCLCCWLLCGHQQARVGEQGRAPQWKPHADKTPCASQGSWLHLWVPKHTWRDVLTKDKGWKVYSKYHSLSDLTFSTGFYFVFSIRNSTSNVWFRQWN